MNWYKIALKIEKKDTTNTDSTISSIHSLGTTNPLNPQEVVINYVKVNVSQYNDSTIWLKSIESMFPKQGNGTVVLRQIIDIANRNNVSIYLDPMTSGGIGNISKQKLISWYKSNGFVNGEGDGDFKYGLIHYSNSSH